MVRPAPLALVVVLVLLGLAAPAQAAGLRAGSGSADITPRTGYYLGGWTRADRIAGGQHTRLYARSLVLERGGKKVALVAIDLFMVPAGLLKHAAERAGGGFSEQNVLISASHTHSGPGGYANFKTFNTAAPSLQTATDPLSFFRLLNPEPADPQLYTFLVNQIATSIRRADANKGPAVAGWGSAEIHGLTQNRSVEAHLANHGIIREHARGSARLDPQGIDHTIDPAVNVLRVDKVVRRGRKRKRRRVPIGAWSTFADHGTVTKSSFQYYNADHHGSATRVFEQRVRKEGKVPGRQRIVNVYGNSNEGDMSAGLDRHGPAASDYVGRVEAGAMLRAWRQARRSGLTANPALDVRWTRPCFCGQKVEGGPVSDRAVVGMPFLTGSEEERGPLYDVTGVPLEGRRLPASIDPAQGNKSGIPVTDAPKGVPLMAVRVRDRMIVTVPGEATKEVGERIRGAVMSQIGGSGVSRVVVSGLANEFIQYVTTPQEYDRQEYEGGSTLYGKYESNLIKNELASLARRLVNGQPAQAPLAMDPTNGVTPNGPAYGSGAASGSILAQPAAAYRRLGHATMSWQGGAEGLDRPLDRAFVTIQRRVKRRWRQVTSDLGLQILWTIDANGRYNVKWEIPLNARKGRYRIVVTAKRYRLVSRSFGVLPYNSMTVRGVGGGPGRVAVELRYPAPKRDVDLTWRPRSARGGKVRFRVGRRTVAARRKRGTVFSVNAPAGAPVSIPPGFARDRHGNANPAAVRLR